MHFQIHPNAATSVPIAIAAEPVHNILHSIALLSQLEQLPALDGWVVRTAATLTPEQRHTNRLIFDYLLDALLPNQDWPDFPAYLADLAGRKPEEQIANGLTREQIRKTHRTRFKTCRTSLRTFPTPCASITVNRRMTDIWTSSVDSFRTTGVSTIASC